MENRIPVGEGASSARSDQPIDRDELFGRGLDQLGELRARVDELTSRLRVLVRERPATSLLVALGAGYLVGRLLRA